MHLCDNFRRISQEIAGRTLVGGDKQWMIYQLARHAGTLPGDMAELGVYKGGTTYLIAKTCSHKKIQTANHQAAVFF